MRKIFKIVMFLLVLQSFVYAETRVVVFKDNFIQKQDVKVDAGFIYFDKDKYLKNAQQFKICMFSYKNKIINGLFCQPKNSIYMSYNKEIKGRILKNGIIIDSSIYSLTQIKQLFKIKK